VADNRLTLRQDLVEGDETGLAHEHISSDDPPL
jgi:hypothetical protein